MPSAPHDRWPLLVDAAPAPTSSPARASFVAVALVLLALAALVPLGLVARTAIVGAGVVAALAALAVRRRAAPTSTVGHVTLEGARVVRSVGERTLELGDLDGGLGVALLGSHDRSRAVLAFTCGATTRYVPVRLRAGSTRTYRLLASATLVAEGDLADLAEGLPSLDAGDAAELVERVTAHDARALRRIVLTDAHGEPVRIDGERLEAAGRAFDLTAPFEWRPFMFHESIGAVTVLYRATWVRQGASELVLVAPLPTEEGAPIARASVPEGVPDDVVAELRRGALRDVRLAQSLPEAPPPRELRVSIDRPFVLAFRRLLDEAPLGARLHVPEPSRRTAERRAP